MSSINGLGLELFRHVERTSTTRARDSETAQPVGGSDSEGDGNAGSAGRSGDESSPFGRALLMTLSQFGVDAQEFQDSFLAALRSIHFGAGHAASFVNHINTVG